MGLLGANGQPDMSKLAGMMGSGALGGLGSMLGGMNPFGAK